MPENPHRIYFRMIASLVFMLYVLLYFHLNRTESLVDDIVEFNNLSSDHNFSMGCQLGKEFDDSSIHLKRDPLLFSRNVTLQKKIIKMLGPTQARKTVIYKQCIQMIPEHILFHEIVKWHMDCLLTAHNIPLRYDDDTMSRLQIAMIIKEIKGIDYDSAVYLVEHYRRLMDMKQSLTIRDYLYVGTSTTGYSEMSFVLEDGTLCDIYDISAQVHKWKNILADSPPSDAVLFVIPFTKDLLKVKKWIAEFNLAMVIERGRCKRIMAIITGHTSEYCMKLDNLLLQNVVNVSKVMYVDAFNETFVKDMIERALF